MSTGGRVLATKADLAKISLTTPVCTEIGEKISLSRRVEKHWRFVNYFKKKINLMIKECTSTIKIISRFNVNLMILKV